uniref:DIS3-like exonuclease 2 n=1 Tax=Cacopsylla melanoneura TaxID=428564 RepID=A0A8D8V125_9HEMI
MSACLVGQRPLDKKMTETVRTKQKELKHIFQTIADCAEENNKRTGDTNKFEPYWKYLDVEHGLNRKTLYQGIFHVNRNNKDIGYVTPPCCILGKDDIHVVGLKNRNRAFEGDKVVVKILHFKQWVKDQKKKEGIAPTGRIVYILELNHPRTSLGRIEKLDTKQPVACLGFESLDPCVPPVAIVQEFLDWKQKQEDSSPFSSVFYTQAQFLQGLLYYVKVNSYPVCNIAKGQLVDVIGSQARSVSGSQLICLLQRELSALIDKYRFRVQSYEDRKLRSINKHFTREYEEKSYIGEADLDKRVDLTDRIVFSIAPHDRSPDEACVGYSVRSRPNDSLEVQVHVSDVATYLSREVPTDGKNKPLRGPALILANMYKTLVKTAEFNCISVSTQNRRISSLLPAALRKICALTPGERKLALTFEFLLDKDGKEIGESRLFGSVIESTAHLTYAHVNKLIDSPTIESLNWLATELAAVAASTVKPKSKTKLPAAPKPPSLDRLSLLRTSVLSFVSRSSEAVAQAEVKLDLPKPDVKFTIQNEVPTRVHVAYGLNKLDSLVSHWTHRVESCAANRLIANFPNSALLLRQPGPDQRLFQVLADFLRANQIELDVSDPPVSLAKSWQKFRTLDPECRNLVPILLVLFDQVLPEPELCTPFHADSTHHYTRNQEYVTQLTSPLHHFTHIIVQKQLLSALELNSGPKDTSLDTPHYMKTLADAHNRLAAEIQSLNKNAREMYLAMQLGYKSNCLNCPAVIVAVYEQSVEILIPSLYLRTTLYLDKYEHLTRMESGLWTHQVSWTHPQHVQSLSLLSTIPVRLTKCAYNFSVNVDLRHPLNKGEDGVSLLVEPQGAEDHRSGPSILSQISASDINALCKSVAAPGFAGNDLPSLLGSPPPPKPTSDKPKRERNRNNKKGKSESLSDTANSTSGSKPTTPLVGGPGSLDPSSGSGPSSSWFGQQTKMSKQEARAATKTQTKINDLLASQIESLTMNSSDSDSDSATNVNKTASPSVPSATVPASQGPSATIPSPNRQSGPQTPSKSSDGSSESALNQQSRPQGTFVRPSESASSPSSSQPTRPQTLSRPSEGASSSSSPIKPSAPSSAAFKASPFLIPDTAAPTTTSRSTPYSYTANSLSRTTTAPYPEEHRPSSSSSSSSNTQSPTDPKKPKQPDNCVLS